MTSSPPTNATNADSQGIELVSIDNVRAEQHFDGEQVSLAMGTLRALLVAISLDDGSAKQATDAEKRSQQQAYSTDLWLVLSIGDNFSLPIPAFQNIRPERAGSATAYVMPSHDVEGASIKIALPASTPQQQTRRFEEVLSQYSAYQDDHSADNGAIELIDDTGHIIGHVQGQFTVEEDDALSESGREKEPVLVDLHPEPVSTSDNDKVHVGIAPQDAEKKDWLLKGADFLSRNIVKGSEFIGTKITNAAENYTSKSPAAGSLSTSTSEKGTSSGTHTPTRESVKIPGAAQSGASTLFQLSGHAVQISTKTTGKILQVAANVGDKVGKKTGIQRQVNPDGSMGPAPKGIRGFVNRSLIATNTVLEGIDAGAQHLLFTGSDAASSVVAHRYGEDAKTLSQNVAKSGKNVYICYRSFSGIRRSALLKAAGGRVLKAKLEDGSEVKFRVDEKGRATVEPSDDASAGAGAGAGSASASASASGTLAKKA